MVNELIVINKSQVSCYVYEVDIHILKSAVVQCDTFVNVFKNLVIKFLCTCKNKLSLLTLSLVS